MKKNYLFLATAAIMMASCANDDFSGDNTSSPTGTGAIAFNMNTPAMSRADNTSQLSGSSAADKLNKMFIVWGEKNETDGTNGNCGADVAAANTVFQNYRVNYESRPANTTTSNTDDWEYVGVTSFNNSVTPNAPQTQTIKYWDDAASSYTFTAVSAKADDINSKVGITKIIKSSSTTPSVYDKGYTIELKDGASLGDIYLSDRKPVMKEESATAYGHQAVQLTFRNFQSKIRFGIYETVPGYKVVITGIKYNGSTVHPTQATEGTESDKTFGIDGNFVVAGKSSTDGSENTKYTVTYTSANKAQVTVANGYNSQSYLNTKGTNWLSTSTSSPVGTTADKPTWDNVTTTTSGQDDNSTTTTTVNWTSILPNPSNSTDLKLTVSYDLYSEDTGEKISVGYKTVTVPSEYCQWKSNYAYTYLFKITDTSADLYPITFDAVVETEDNGNWESITEVSEPSITTFGVKDSKIVTGKNEYEAGSTIYATVMTYNTTDSKYDNVTLKNEEGSTNIALYTVETSDATNFPITEASVAQSIASTATGTKKITCPKVDATSGETTNWSIETSVPTENGGTVSISALKWTPSSAATYAIEFTKDSKKYYKIVKVVASN